MSDTITESRPETDAESQPEPQPETSLGVVSLAAGEELEGDLKEIYDLVSLKVKLIVSTGKFSQEHLRPLILNVIEIVQNYTKGKYAHIDGAQKKAMALNVLRHVIVTLYQNGQLDKDQYEMILLGLEFFGGALMDMGKVVYNALVNVAEDISENGCAGCFGRNCSKKHPKK